MKRIFSVLVLTLLTSTLLYAQTKEIERLLTPTKQLLTGKGAQLSSFRSTLYDSSGRELERQAGKLYTQAENFRLEYGAIIAVFSGKRLSHYNKDEHTLTFSEPSSEELVQINPLYFLRSYATQYQTSLLPESKLGAIVSFTPKQRGNIKCIELLLERQNLKPIEITVLAADGYRLIIKIDELRSIPPRDKNFYTLDAKSYPGVEIVSLD